MIHGRRFYLLIAVFVCFTNAYMLSQSTITTEKNILVTSYCNNWKSFQQKYHNQICNPEAKLPILFIGDSHIQGGYFTNRIRNLFREQGYVAGQGFTFPYAFTHTNGPENLLFRSSINWEHGKLIIAAFNINSPFGYIVCTKEKRFDLTFAYKTGDPDYPLQKIILFHSQCKFNITSSEPADVEKNGCLSKDIYFTELHFHHPVNSYQLSFHISDTSEKFNLFSIYSESASERIPINAIGINGMSYQQYSEKINLDPWLSFLHPECIVIALGTNDVFCGIKDSNKIRNSILKIVRKIKLNLPGSVIILTTPNDHLRKRKYTNRFLPEICSIIKQVAIEEQCAYWDFFSVMGGLGSARDWNAKGLLFKDFVHLSKIGYKLQAELFYEAFQDALTQPEI